jgi:beta-ribofuranosylaminobenzene 5'-phosphate synthase
MPPSWQILLLRPQVGVVREAGAEASFFQENTPVPPGEVLEAIAAVYHGLLPAVLSDDLEAFGHWLRQLQDVGFKRRELLGQPTEVRDMLKVVQEMFPAAGMSSMGPLLFAIDTVDRKAEVGQFMPNVQVLGPVAPANAGYAVARDE